MSASEKHTTTCLLIRHGETDAVGKVLAGRIEGWGLNSKGKRQVSLLAQRLSRLAIRQVYSSPLQRAMATARQIARAHGLEPLVMEYFDEIRFGEWEGMTFEKLRTRDDWNQYNASRTRHPPPGGESIQEVQARMIRGIEYATAQHPGTLLAIISHADPLRAVVAHYLGLPLDHLSRFEISPASVTVAEFAEHGPRLVCLNETYGLPYRQSLVL
jgi:broad specificity phosphatase PhoE